MQSFGLVIFSFKLHLRILIKNRELTLCISNSNQVFPLISNSRSNRLDPFLRLVCCNSRELDIVSVDRSKGTIIVFVSRTLENCFVQFHEFYLRMRTFGYLNPVQYVHGYLNPGVQYVYEPRWRRRNRFTGSDGRFVSRSFSFFCSFSFSPPFFLSCPSVYITFYTYGDARFRSVLFNFLREQHRRQQRQRRRRPFPVWAVRGGSHPSMP